MGPHTRTPSGSSTVVETQTPPSPASPSSVHSTTSLCSPPPSALPRQLDIASAPTPPLTQLRSSLSSTTSSSTGSSTFPSPPWSPRFEYAKGYPKLARHVGNYPERMIFRRFSALNSQSLLYMQAQLCSMEEELRELEFANEKAWHKNAAAKNPNYRTNPPPSPFLLWKTLASGPNRTQDEKRQWDLSESIRVKLKEYNKALIQQATIAKFPELSPYDLNAVQTEAESCEVWEASLFLGLPVDPQSRASSSTPHCSSTITASPDNSLNITQAFDLVALAGRHDGDTFSKWVTESLMTRIFRRGLHRYLPFLRNRPVCPVHGELEYNDKKLIRLAFILISVFTSQLPLISIIVLYYVKNTAARLGLISGFALIVVGCLAFFTKAKAVDVFLVTAAFAAIQVIFIGGNESGTAAASQE